MNSISDIVPENTLFAEKIFYSLVLIIKRLWFKAFLDVRIHLFSQSMNQNRADLLLVIGSVLSTLNGFFR